MTIVVVVAFTSPAAVAQEQEPPSPLYQQLRAVLEPLAPAAVQIADGMAVVNAALVEAAIAGGSRSEELAPAIEQAEGALATFRTSLAHAVASAAPLLVQAGAGAETLAGEIAALTSTLDSALAERAAQLERVYAALGPALPAACEANGQMPLLLNLTPYGFALGGVFAPLTTVCTDVAPPPAPPTDRLEPVLAQYAALLEGAGYTLEPVKGPLQPAFEPACSALVVVQTAGIFVTLPLETEPVQSPALATACGIGQGTSPLAPAVVFLSVASAPFVPPAEDAVGSVEVFVPVVAPFRPVLDPALAGACATAPAAGQLGPLLPVPLPMEPTVFISAGTTLLCAVAETIDDLGGGDAGSSGGGLAPANDVPSFVPPPVFVPEGPEGVVVIPEVPSSNPIAAPAVAQTRTPVGGLSPRLWAPLVPLAALALVLIGWVRWNRALTRLRAAGERVMS